MFLFLSVGGNPETSGLSQLSLWVCRCCSRYGCGLVTGSHTVNMRKISLWTFWTLSRFSSSSAAQFKKCVCVFACLCMCFVYIYVCVCVCMFV